MGDAEAPPLLAALVSMLEAVGPSPASTITLRSAGDSGNGSARDVPPPGTPSGTTAAAAQQLVVAASAGPPAARGLGVSSVPPSAGAAELTAPKQLVGKGGATQTPDGDVVIPAALRAALLREILALTTGGGSA